MSTATTIIDPIHAEVEEYVAANHYDRILDIGAWFIPYPRATHVIDILPWETRGCKFQPHPNPGERFSKESWVMLDICNPSVRFPFEDKYFDFVICSGTLEDLPRPEHCVREMIRVGRAGYLRVPSIYTELTMGVEDRANSVIGYHHHHWVCEESSGKLAMYAKPSASWLHRSRNYIPLPFFERYVNAGPERWPRDVHFFWRDSFLVCYSNEADSREKISQLLSSFMIPRNAYLKDWGLRSLRKARDVLKSRGGFTAKKSKWWNEMLLLSKPYCNAQLFAEMFERK